MVTLENDRYITFNVILEMVKLEYQKYIETKYRLYINAVRVFFLDSIC